MSEHPRSPWCPLCAEEDKQSNPLAPSDRELRNERRQEAKAKLAEIQTSTRGRLALADRSDLDADARQRAIAAGQKARAAFDPLPIVYLATPDDPDEFDGLREPLEVRIAYPPVGATNDYADIAEWLERENT